MAVSKGRLIASNFTSAGIAEGGSSGSGVTNADSIGVFAAAPDSGTLHYAKDTKALYLFDGSEYDRVFAGPNELITFDSALPASILLKGNQRSTGQIDSATSIIRFKASADFEGFPITYSYQTVPTFPAQLDSAFGDDSASGGTGIIDSSSHSTDPRVTLLPSATLGDAGQFILRMKATDGTHVVSSSSTVGLEFTEGDYFYIANASNAVDTDVTSGVSEVFGSAVSLATVGGYPSHNGGISQNNSGGGANNAIIFDLSTTGGFDASTDCIIFSFYLAAETGNTIGMGVFDDAASKSMTIATGPSGLGVLDTGLSTFSNWANNGQWVIGMWGGGTAISTINGTTSSGFRMWPAQTGGTSTLGTEISAATASAGGYTPPTISKPGMVFWNGGSPGGSYATGYLSRSALAYNLRSFQVYYDQTTSGRTVEQIVGGHQKKVFT